MGECIGLLANGVFAAVNCDYCIGKIWNFRHNVTRFNQSSHESLLLMTELIFDCLHFGFLNLFRARLIGFVNCDRL